VAFSGIIHSVVQWFDYRERQDPMNDEAYTDTRYPLSSLTSRVIAAAYG